MIGGPPGIQHRNPLMRWVMRHATLSTLFRDSTVMHVPGYNRGLSYRTIPLSGSEIGMDQTSANIQAGSYDLAVQTVPKTVPRTPPEAASTQNIQRSTAPVPLSSTSTDAKPGAPVSKDVKSTISDTDWRRLQTILRRHEARQVTNPVNSSEAFPSMPAQALPEEQEFSKTRGTVPLDQPATRKKTGPDIPSQDRHRAEITYIAPPEHQAPESISPAATGIHTPLQAEPARLGELPGVVQMLQESPKPDEQQKQTPSLEQTGTQPKEIVSAGAIVQRAPLVGYGETDISGFAQQDKDNPENKIRPETLAEVAGFTQPDTTNPENAFKSISPASQPVGDESSFRTAPSRVISLLPGNQLQPLGQASPVGTQNSDTAFPLRQASMNPADENAKSTETKPAGNQETVPPTDTDIESTSHPQLQAVPLQQAWPVQRVEEPTSPEIETLYPHNLQTSPPIPSQSGSPNVVQKFTADSHAQEVSLTPEAETEKRKPIPPTQDIVPPNDLHQPIQESNQTLPSEASPVQRFSLEELRQPINAPKYIETEIGPLPEDLWRLLDKEPPQSASKLRGQIANLPGVETATQPFQYGSSILGSLPSIPALESIPHQAENNALKEGPMPLASDEPEKETGVERSGDQIEIDALARKVYSKLRHRLSNEWERLRR